MNGYVTSFSGLFNRETPNTASIDRIEIPLIQRDYAQGREGSVVVRIRHEFLDVLHAAVVRGEAVSLDFIYGDLAGGVLRPLDGQQRLTTLFLLHWYLAFRAQRPVANWRNFAYATRPSARLFCKRLGEHQPAADRVTTLSAWIKDQPWYQYTWRHDPSIQSMLVMLDLMDEKFRNDDCVAAWQRLVDNERPAISFHLLPIPMGEPEDLYIKMNSRGKPLTPFETFKARFEQMLQASNPKRAKEFGEKVDGSWCDLLWKHRSDNNLIDDEFLRYIRFVTEICAWRDGGPVDGETLKLAERVYGQESPSRADHLDFLFNAFDTWNNEETSLLFSSLFSVEPIASGSAMEKLVLFDVKHGLDLFSACCRHYGRRSEFSLAQTILLYGVLLHRIHQTANFRRRLRILRNLVEASGNEIREERMPNLLADVRRVVVDGTLDGVGELSFRPAQVEDERLKVRFVATHPAIEKAVFNLEDHRLLRGCLTAFEYDEARFQARTAAFHQLFSGATSSIEITGALLAIGDYSRKRQNSRMHQFGPAEGEERWREVLADAGRPALKRTRAVLGALLDKLSADALSDVPTALKSVQQAWLDMQAPASGLDWRWYLVKYPAMREGRSGIYVGLNGTLGYSICMLNKTRMSSYYYDAYLWAIYRESKVSEDAIAQPWPFFYGYETEDRWLELSYSGTRVRCVDEGFLVLPPSGPSAAAKIETVYNRLNIRADRLLVPQVERDGFRFDTVDRVQLGAALLRDLVNEGL